MNLSQIQAFLAVVDEESFSAAAKLLGISQPAVTMQIRALEDDLGVTLLDRRYRRIDLTEAGQELLGHARRIVAEVENARTGIVELKGSVSGHLSIIASTTPGEYVIPALLGAFMRAYPQVSISLSVGDSAEVVRAIEDGSADVGVAGVAPGGKLVGSELGADELIVIAAPGHPLLAVDQVKTKDLAKHAWILREQGSGTRAVTEIALTERGLAIDALDVVVELGSGEAIIGAVEGGLGISMLSRFVADKSLRLGTVVEVPLAKKIHRPFYSLLPKGTPTRAALAFRDYLHDSVGS